MQVIQQLSDKVDRGVKVLVFLCIVAMIAVITIQILFRVLFDALTWSEELSRYLLVWSTFLGATLAYKRGMHIAVTFVVDLAKGKGKKFLSILSILLSIVFFAVAILYGLQYIQLQSIQVSAALRIPMRYVYIVLPLSFSIMILHGLARVVEILRGGEVA